MFKVERIEPIKFDSYKIDISDVEDEQNFSMAVSQLFELIEQLENNISSTPK